MIRITLTMALREIRRNTLRSFLTMLGIVFGVVPAQRAGRLDPVVALRSE